MVFKRQGWRLGLVVAVLSIHASGAAAPGNTSNLASCVATSASSLEQLLSNSTNVTSTLMDGLAAYSQRCLGVAVNVKPIRLLVPLIGNLPRWMKRAKEFEAMTGVSVVLNPVTFYLVSRELFLELSSSPIHDGFIFDPIFQGAAASVGGFADLGPLIQNTAQSLNWADFLPYYREVSAAYGRKTVAVPLDGDLFLMYYRADLFSRYNLTVPDTWDDFLDIARTMNGTDTDGDGQPDLFGACFDILPYCKGGFLVPAVAGSYIQYEGTSQGLWFDPDTIPDVKPLMNNAGMAAALKFWQDIYPFTNRTKSCAGPNTDFQAGRCLMTVNWGDELRGTMSSKFFKPGMLGLAPLPGSSRVLDRRTNTLVDCDPDLCPYSQSKVDRRTGQQVWVNTAPYPAFGGWSGAVSSRTTPEQQQSVLDFFAFLTNPDNSWADILALDTGIDPFREQHVQDVDRWVNAGYDRTLITKYLDSIKASLSSKNVLLDTRAAYDPAGQDYRWPFDAALINLTSPNPPKDVIPKMMQAMEKMVTDAKLGAIAKSLSGDPVDFAQQYWSVLGHPGSVRAALAAKNTPPVSVDSSSTGSGPTVPIAVTLAVVLSVAVIATLLYVHHVRVQQHRSLLGKVLAPGVGPNTTLVISDIQDSTALYETLPVGMMDACMQHVCSSIRSLIYKHKGYESATEGDSFIIAFHTASDAVCFGIELQEALLNTSWPADLLNLDTCDSVKPVWVSSTEVAVKLKQMLHVAWNRAAIRKPKSLFRMIQQRLLGKQPVPAEAAISFTDQEDFASLPPELQHSNISYPASDADASDADMEYEFRAFVQNTGSLTGFENRVPSKLEAPILEESDGSYIAAGTVGRQSESGPRRAVDSMLSRKDAKLNEQQPETTIIRQLATQAWAMQPHLLELNKSLSATVPQAGASVRVFQGFRVRVAIHSGVEATEDVMYSKSAGSTQYSGSFLEVTKMIEAAANGGQVLMSLSTFNLLERVKLPADVMLLHLGEHVVEAAGKPVSEGCASSVAQAQEGIHLYTALYASALPRLALLPAPRTDHTLAFGVLDAPIGTITIGFLKVVGTADIKAWNLAEATSALATFSTIVKQNLLAAGGYLVEHVDGFVLVAFTSAMAALTFAVKAQQALVQADWSPRLLKYALTEELAVSQVDANGQQQKIVLMRGLRMKAGFDIGVTKSQVHPNTGKMAYRGKPMNRAARIQTVANSGQILCSSEAWAAAMASALQPRAALQGGGLACIRVGELQLKGIKDKLDIYQVQAESRAHRDVRAVAHLKHNAPSSS